CVDRNPAKQDTLLPGSRIPVRMVDALRDAKPDYVLILPWNLRDEIMSQLADLTESGTRFVTAVPEIRVS
ncbi:MAG: SAM-dependent methyltransferase, partial [Rhodobacteraceae bacterium]|nr:SAM-dependent methyltransferase [Paracoccaceae bacterium]